MQLSDEVKKQILEGFIDIFTRISNVEYQKRIWVKGEGPEVDDFDDTACDFFGECDSILENYKDFKITDEQYHLLVTFRDMFDAFVIRSRQYLPEEFIATPEWGRIAEMAKDVLKAFDYKKIRK